MRFSLLATMLVFTACPADKPAAGAGPGDDALIRKLKAEQTRLAKVPPGMREALAKAAVSDEAPVALKTPATGPMHFKGVLISLKSLERSHSVKNSAISISTADAFLKLTLSAEATKEQPFDLSGVTLEQGIPELLSWVREQTPTDQVVKATAELETHQLVR